MSSVLTSDTSLYSRQSHPVSCIVGDLGVDGVFLSSDLSKNRLADVPSEVCHLVALETLNLYHNCIRTIPDSIISLQSLTSLNLRYKPPRSVWSGVLYEKLPASDLCQSFAL